MQQIKVTPSLSMAQRLLHSNQVLETGNCLQIHIKEIEWNSVGTFIIFHKFSSSQVLSTLLTHAAAKRADSWS